jgi:predicted nucleotidyltransferase
MLIYLLSLTPLIPSFTPLHKRETLTKNNYSLAEYKVSNIQLFTLLNKLKTKADIDTLVEYDNLQKWLEEHKLQLFNAIKTTIFLNKQEALDFLEKC